MPPSGAVPVGVEPTMPFPSSPASTCDDKPTPDPEKAEETCPTLVNDTQTLKADDEFPEGGRGWFVVLGSFIYASLGIGWPLVWGVFQSYFIHNNTFPGTSVTTLSFLGTIQNAVRVAHCSGPAPPITALNDR
jgi:hypothetical protein